MRGFGGLAGFGGLPSVAALDGSLSDVGARRKYPFELEKAIHNVMFIQHHMQRQDEFDAVSPARVPHLCHVISDTPICPQEDQDWGFVAMVLDRLFLWIFTIASIVGTFAILCEAPSLYDDTKSIDMELSLVAKHQFRPDLDL
ncbi:Nicotinic acetylcholine receptor alpha2 variant A [Gryllus bimaculatus]|nr:Nicotinic acetylcholine receptor alpha2 variant A [Gryllus bimaculatus]